MLSALQKRADDPENGEQNPVAAHIARARVPAPPALALSFEFVRTAGPLLRGGRRAGRFEPDTTAQIRVSAASHRAPIFPVHCVVACARRGKPDPAWRKPAAVRNQSDADR